MIMRRHYVFLILLLVMNITCFAQNAFVVIDKYEKTQDNKLSIKFHVVNGRPTDSYKINVHLYIKHQEQKLFSVSGDFKNFNGSSKSGQFYWDVLKDIAEFPKISDIYVEIGITGIVKNKINTISDNVKNSPEDSVVSNNDKSSNDISNSSYNINEQLKRVDDRKEINSSGYFSLLGFEYDYYDKTYQVDIFRMGIAGFVWVLGTLNSSKDQYNNTITIPSIGTKVEFKAGGPIFKGLDICLVGTANLASNSLLAENKDNKRKNEDIYEKTNFFGGLELSSNFHPQKGSFINFYIKAGFDSKNLAYKYVQSDYSYSNKVTIGPTQYFTITFGANLLNFSNDILHLWY